MKANDSDSKTAIVTGSSGGIGGSVALALCNLGYKVLGLDQKPASLIHENFSSVIVDLSDEEEIAESLSKRPSKAEVIVHCAAEQPQISTASQGARSHWVKAFSVNVLALETLTSLLLHELEESDSARIVAIGSVHDKSTSKSIAPYSVSKAGLAGWVRAAAIDLATRRIPVIGISAGAVDSPKLREGLARFADPEEAMVGLVSKLPSGRLVSTKDVADLVIFMLSPAGHNFTGSNVSFDGGISGVLASE